MIAWPDPNTPITYIVQSGKVRADLDTLLLRVQESDNFQISPLGLDELICLKEQTEIPEMHDRFIVCERRFNKWTVHGARVAP